MTDFEMDPATERLIPTGKSLPLDLLLLGRLIRALLMACERTGYSLGKVGVLTMVFSEDRTWSLEELSAVTGLGPRELEAAIDDLDRRQLVERVASGVRPNALGHEERIRSGRRFIAELGYALDVELKKEAMLVSRLGPHIRPAELMASILLCGGTAERMETVATLASMSENQDAQDRS